MNELERIIQRNFLPKTFFLPEEKSGFYVSEERKALWAVLLDLLLEFQRICEVHGLTYFAICGTILGAIRHHGFIPWDDDIDIAMPRSDYEKLKKIRFELKYPYSLVWPIVESENGYSFLKLRNSETTGMSKALSHLNINHGIYLDIFPLDEVNQETYMEEQLKMKDLLIWNSNNMKILKSENEDKDSIRDDIITTFNKIEDKAQQDNGKGYEKLALRTISFYTPDRLIWDKNDFSTTCVVPFEKINIRIPVGWKNILEINYGKWEEMPPIEDRGKWHSSVLFDPYISYLNYKYK